MSFLLEVIASSCEDALEAEQGGAGRVELCISLQQGGLTPPLAMVEEVVARLTIPCRAMICENPSYLTPDSAELNKLITLTKEISALPIDGIVIGFATPEGQLDLKTLETLADAAPATRITFHRIFETFTDPFSVLKQLKSFQQIDRILLCRAIWNRLAIAASPVRLIAGGGLREEDFRYLLQNTTIREFHTGRAVRDDGKADGKVQALLVRRLIEAIQA